MSDTLRGDYGDTESDWNSLSLCKTAINGRVLQRDAAQTYPAGIVALEKRNDERTSSCKKQVNSAGDRCRHHDIKDPKQDLAPCLGRDLPSCLSSSLSTNRLKLSVPTQLLVDHRRGNFFRRHLAGHPERGFQAFNFRSGRNVSASQDLECQVQSCQRAHRDSNMPHLA